jgi:hypothetical protein
MIPLLRHSSRRLPLPLSTQVRRAATAPPPPPNPAILRRSPTVEDIEAAELDVELLPQRDAKLAITERAAEVRQRFYLR